MKIRRGPEPGHRVDWCEEVHQRASGKLLTDTVLCHFTQAGVRCTRPDSGGGGESPDGADPTKGVSFNLGLTLSASERKAKREVKLPYTHSQAQKGRELAGGNVLGHEGRVGVLDHP